MNPKYRADLYFLVTTFGTFEGVISKAQGGESPPAAQIAVLGDARFADVDHAAQRPAGEVHLTCIGMGQSVGVGVGADAHSTERRLTGKIQAMMSDPRLRGRVTWLLMTARIHLLSPDIRRPGRVGDLIIPVLDPEGAFVPLTTFGEFVPPCVPVDPHCEDCEDMTANFWTLTAADGTFRKEDVAAGKVRLKEPNAVVEEEIAADSPRRRMWELHRQEIHRLGSVAERTLRLAPCPVLTVKASGEE